MFNSHSKLARIALILAAGFAATGCSATKHSVNSTWDAPLAVEVAPTSADNGFHVFTKSKSDQRVCLHMHSSDASVAVPKAYSTAPGLSGFQPESGIVKLWSDLDNVVCYDTPAGHHTSVARQDITCKGEGTAEIVVQAYTPGPVAGMGDAPQRITVTCDGGAATLAAVR